ncbi:hypothetical protein CVT24_006446, partial [Panaeolus cyanescens]
MSGLKNSPFAKRLRSSRTDTDDSDRGIGSSSTANPLPAAFASLLASSSKSASGSDSTGLGSASGSGSGSNTASASGSGSNTASASASGSTPTPRSKFPLAQNSTHTFTHNATASSSSSATTSSSHSHTRSGSSSMSNPFVGSSVNTTPGTPGREGVGGGGVLGSGGGLGGGGGILGSPTRGKTSVSYGYTGASGAATGAGAGEDSPRRKSGFGVGAYGGYANGSGSGIVGAGGGGGPFSESPKRASKNRAYGDRFVPSKDVVGDMRTAYYLKEEVGGSLGKGRVIPSESDALKEEANLLFNSILHTEVNPPISPRRPISPSRGSGGVVGGATMPSTPNRRRIFDFSTPNRKDANTTPSRRLDLPTDEAYSMSPIRKESRQLLESPRNTLRNVSKTPYRVLDAPELADDFYLNLVDWSSTNVLGVGLGSCVYLWTAHNAVVSKLCDLAGSGDVVSSVSWVQRGTTLAVGTLAGRMHIYDASTLQLQRTYQHAHHQRIGAIAWN